jgi:hypothetical protein
MLFREAQGVAADSQLRDHRVPGTREIRMRDTKDIDQKSGIQ